MFDFFNEDVYKRQDGLVDVEGILTEMSDNISNTKPFKVETGLLGQLEICLLYTSRFG